MRKPGGFDGGSFESPAVLGEDFAQGLQLLRPLDWGMELRVPESWTHARGFDPVPYLLSLLATVSLGLLVHAWSVGDARLGGMVLALGATAAWTLYRLWTSPIQPEMVMDPVLQRAVCRICEESYLVDPDRGKDPEGLAAAGVDGVSLCSLRCAEAWHRGRRS